MKTIGLLVSVVLIIIACDPGGERTRIDVANKNKPVLNPKPSFPGPIVFFGDDIAKGTGYSQESYFWKDCFGSITQRQIINKGYDQLTSDEAIDKTDNVLNLKPVAVIVSLGLVDSFIEDKSQTISEQETFRNLRDVYRKFTATGALVVHLGVSPGYKNTHRLNELGRITKEEGILYISKSMNGLWNKDYLSSEITPNDDGYTIMCSNLINGMRSYFDFRSNK